jgi:putative membrane protein
MIPTAAHPSETLARCIAEVEARTRAEVVFLLRESSGNYRDVDHLFAAAVSFALLLFLLFSPVEFHPVSIPLPLLFTYGFAAVLCRYSPLRRWLTPRDRRERQVLRGAEAAFVHLGILKTRARTGVLIYVSRMEGRCWILPDSGAEVAFPKEARERFEQAFAEGGRRRENLEVRIGGVLRTLGVHLERELPPEDDLTLRTNELPDHALIGSTREDASS